MSSNSSSPESEEENSSKFYAERLERLAKLKMVEDEKNTDNKPAKNEQNNESKSSSSWRKGQKSLSWHQNNEKKNGDAKKFGKREYRETRYKGNMPNEKPHRDHRDKSNTGDEKSHRGENNPRFNKKETGEAQLDRNNRYRESKPNRDRRMSDASTCSAPSKPITKWNSSSQLPSFNGGAGQGPYNQIFPTINGPGVNGYNQGPMNLAQYQANYQPSIPALMTLPQQQAPPTPEPVQFLCNVVRDLRDMNLDMIKRINHMHGSLEALHKNNGFTDNPTKLSKEFKSFEKKFGTLNDALQCLQLSVDAKVDDSTSKVLNNQSEVAILKIQMDELTTMVQVCKDNGCGALQEIRSQDGKMQLFQADLQELKENVIEMKYDVTELKTGLAEVKKMIKNLDLQTNICTICMARSISVCLIPCGHLLCNTCADTSRHRDGQCPTCRTLITNLQRAFLP